MIKKFFFSLFICSLFLCNFAFASEKNYYILVDKDNNKLNDYVFTNVSSYSSYDFYSVKILGGKNGILDKNGQFIVEPVDGYISAYSNDRFIINERKIVDRDKNVLFTVEDNPDARILVYSVYDGEKNKKVGIVNENGIEKVPAIYEQMNLNVPISTVFSVKKDGKWGRINKDGKILTDFIYDNPIHYILNNGIAIVIDDTASE